MKRSPKSPAMMEVFTFSHTIKVSAFNSMVFKPMYRLTSSPEDAPQSKHTFVIDGVGLSLKAVIQKQLYFQFGLYHSTQSVDFEGVNITGAKGGYQFSPEATVEVGMVGIPLANGYGYFLTTPPITATQRDVVEKVTIGRGSFGGPSGLGVSFFGKKEKVSYKANIVNASQSNYILN